MRVPIRSSPARLVQLVALLVAGAGLVFWSTLLLRPAESSAPVVAAQVQAARSDSAALQWFSNQPAPVDIKVSGVLAGVHGAFAILALNDAAPRSFRVGERLSQGVRLTAIEADGVIIERGNEQFRLPVEILPGALELPRLSAP